MLFKFTNSAEHFGDRNLMSLKVFKSEIIKESENDDFRKLPLFIKVGETMGPKTTYFRDVVSHPDRNDVFHMVDTNNAIIRDEGRWTS